MRYFLDSEFIENGRRHPIRLISIGIVAEDGRKLYRENLLCPVYLANDWVKSNVLPHLKLGDSMVSMSVIKQDIMEFVGSDPSPEFYGYYSAYDWVVFCQIFGCMVDLPNGWPMWCNDLKQMAVQECGNPTLPKQESTEHNALNDAEWNFEVWKFLDSHRCS